VKMNAKIAGRLISRFHVRTPKQVEAAGPNARSSESVYWLFMTTWRDRHGGSPVVWTPNLRH
jgi:hypothetical protein